MLTKVVTLLALSLGLITATAHAQSSFPDRPIRLIVPTGAGSAPDLLGRTLAERVSAQLGTSIIVENRPGAAGMIGAETVARAKPDGYTLLMAWDGMMAINPHLYPKISYDSQKDFDAVSGLGRVQFVLIAHPSFPAKNLPELIEQAKARPGHYNYGSPGAGEAHHIAMESLLNNANIDVQHIPYKGGPAALNDILGGHVAMGIIGLGPAIPHIRLGRATPIAIVGKERSALLPDLPTIQEQLNTYNAQGSWLGLFAPAGTPPAVLDKLDHAFQQGLASGEMDALLREQAIDRLALNRTQLQELLKTDYSHYRQVIQDNNIKVN